MSEITTRRSGTRSRTVNNPFGCLGCLGTTLALMLLSGALVWAFNPGKSLEDAAREGIIIGGGLSIVGTLLICGLPVLLLLGLGAFVLWRGRRVRRDSSPTIIDIDS